MQGARSLSVDSACVGRNSCRSNRPRHANRHGFLPLLLRCRDGKPSALKSQRTTNLQTQKVRLLSALFYSKESLIPFENWELWKKLHHEQASIEGSLAPRLGNRGQGKSQHPPSHIARNTAKAFAVLAFPYPAESSAIGNTQRHNGGTHMGPHNLQADALLRRLDNSQTRCRKSPQLGRRTTTQCTNLKNTVVQVGKCPGLNNTNCVLSYTSIGDPASNRSSCCFNSANCSCCDWLLQPSRRPEASR